MVLTQNSFEKSLDSLILNPKEKKYLLAVSGGADSMVLLHLFQISGLQFQVAHINYKLRGKDSDADAQLVKDFCKKHQIKSHFYEVSEDDRKPENSIQLWARNLRYEFFFKILKEENLDFIVTAHHLNDELETFFINLSRGSGIKGLSGIPRNMNRILRPLLSFPKEELYRFAEENHIPFREDFTNQKNEYLRNEARNKIVPEIIRVFPNFLENFSSSLSYLKMAEDFIRATVEKKLNEIFIRGNEEEFILNREKLMDSEEFVIIEIIRSLGFSGEEIQKVKNAESGKFFRSKTHEIRLSKNEIICRKRN